MANTLNNMGALREKQGKYSEAESIHRQTLAIRKKALGPEHPDVAASLQNIALVLFNQGKYDETESLYRQALATTEQVFGLEHPEVARILNHLGILYEKQGRFAEAESHYRRALALREKILGSDHHEVAHVLNNLGVLYFRLGKYDKAESHHQRALAIRETVFESEHSDVATSLVNLGALFKHQGKYSEAEQFVRRALTIWKKVIGSDHPNVAVTLHNLGDIYRLLGKYDESKSLLRRALVIREKVFGLHHPDVAQTLNCLAYVYAEQQDYAEAVPLLERALIIRKDALGLNHQAVATNLHDLARLYMDQGRYVEAESLFKRAINIWIYGKALGAAHPAFTLSVLGLAKLYGTTGDYNRSLEQYQRSMKSLYKFIDYTFSFSSERQKLRWIEQYPLLDYSFLSLTLVYGTEEAKRSTLEMILKSKAVVIDAVTAEKEAAFCSYDDEIIQTVKRHSEVCSMIANLTLAGITGVSQETNRDYLKQLHETKDSLEADLSRRCVEFKDELAARRFTVSDVANALPEEAVLWEFVRYEPYDFAKLGSEKDRTGPARYLAFALDHSGEVTLVDLGDASEIDSLVSQARKMIYDCGIEVYSPKVADLERQLNKVTGKLYEMVFAPLEPTLVGRTDILVSPDGQLSLLPFEILPRHDGKYVIESFNVSYLSSGRDLLRYKKALQPSDQALVMADPDFDLSGEALASHVEKTVKGSDVFSYDWEPSRGASGCLGAEFSPLHYGRQELESVISTLKDKGKLTVNAYRGADALEEVLKGMTTAPRVLHLATHGFFCEDIDTSKTRLLENPLLRSGLALAGANRMMQQAEADSVQAETDSLQTEDGILTAFEVSGLNLVGTELAVLSACETGVGDIRNGEGVFGLRRAFQHAGARTILMSLWKVPDKQTYQLMDHFYTTWLEGQSKKAAFRQSVLRVMGSLREKYGVAHPYFWGAFVLIGDPS